LADPHPIRFADPSLIAMKDFDGQRGRAHFDALSD